MTDPAVVSQAAKRAGFVPPTGPGRCETCGFHTPTQGHRDGCQTMKKENTSAHPIDQAGVLEVQHHR
jgi:hypothetical protein